MTISENVIDVDGRPVHYWEDGAENGRALLLLHGVGTAESNWGKVMPTLALDYHVYAPDLPGFGGTAPLPETTFPALIDWLSALLAALDLSNAVIAGNLLAALLARMFASAAPTYVPALILVNGGPIPDRSRLAAKLIDLPLIGGLALEIIGRSTRSHYRIEQMVAVKDVLDDDLLRAWRDNTPGFSALIRAMITHTYTSNEVPPVPTLILWGMDDPVLKVEAARQLHAQLPGSQLELVENCGSLPQLEAPDVFLFQVSNFLDRLARPQARTLPGVGMLHSS